MRHFAVFGFATASKDEDGKLLHIGTDHGKAIDVANNPIEAYLAQLVPEDEVEAIFRTELYELATPSLRRYFTPPTNAEKAKAHLDQLDQPEAGNDEPDAKLLKLSDGARKLIESAGLTAEQIAEIEPTGATGNVVKEDVEAYLAQLATEDDGEDEELAD